jgi:hypothetical protein
VPVPDHVALSASVWGQSDTHFYIADPTWALGLGWADHQLGRTEGLPGIASATDLMAIGLEMSGNRCIQDAPADDTHATTWAFDDATTAMGCFGVPETSAWTEVCRMWPGQIDCDDYFAVIPSTAPIKGRDDNWLNGALVTAHFAVFSSAMWTQQGQPDPLGWLTMHVDQAAAAKMLAVAVYESAFSPEIGQALSGCSDRDVETCLSEPWLMNAVARVGQHAIELSDAAKDNCFTGEIARTDLEAFLDSGLRLYAQEDGASIRSGALAAYDSLEGPADFQRAAPVIFEAMEAHRLTHLDCPDDMLNQWYGANCP